MYLFLSYAGETELLKTIHIVVTSTISHKELSESHSNQFTQDL